jgi:ribosomal protein S27E
MMIGLDVAPFPPEIARVLLLRGVSLPPLSWKTEGNRAAKKILDETDDRLLFGCAALADEPMAAAVRSLLYLWTGWVGECEMFSQAAPQPERMYLSAICERHHGRFSESKAIFKELNGHPVFPPLAEFALQATQHAVDPPLQRLRDMLKIDSAWEPFLFCDALVQATLGKLRTAGDALIRQLQCREFELLLVHCYEQAVGQKLAQRARVEASDAEANAARRERRIREERKRREEKRSREEFAARMQQQAPKPEARAAAAPPVARSEDLVGVLCPKCGNTAQVSGTLRGKAMQCGKCSTAFVVPSKGKTPGPEPRATATAAAASAKPAAGVGVLCPKCRHSLMLPESSRGKKTSCSHCGTVFMVPAAKEAVSAKP